MFFYYVFTILFTLKIVNSTCYTNSKCVDGSDKYCANTINMTEPILQDYINDP